MIHRKLSGLSKCKTYCTK